MTSHDLARASDLASRFDVLSRGTIVASVERADLAQDALLAFYRKALEASERKPAARSLAGGLPG
jgi:heme exporter protein A